MTTVSNVEDRLPYVEPVVLKTSLQFFRESLRDSADVESEEAVFYRTEKEWMQAAAHQRASTELERISRTADPQKEMEDTLQKLSRLYADLKAAQTDARHWTVNAMKRQAQKAAEDKERAGFTVATTGEVVNTTTGEMVEAKVPSAADVKAQEAKDEADLAAELATARANSEKILKAREAIRTPRTRQPRAARPKARPARRGGSAK